MSKSATSEVLDRFADILDGTARSSYACLGCGKPVASRGKLWCSEACAKGEADDRRRD